ncbi:MAG: phosphoglycolate phosphatase [Gammaproteobacteria bacterium]|nr:phosphoglycolate phosphatase [Gammaproteobacteria bacterium]MCP5200700.1 phosphoglycolate phosphatase [Gammaproteobacteria bacterium]
MNAPRRAVLFDLDGTLVDSAPDIAVAVDHALTTHGHAAIGESRVRDYIGHGAARLIHRALTGAVDDDAAPASFDPVFAAFLDAYAVRLCVKTRIYPGVMAILATLAARGWALGVVTNKPARFTAPLLDTLGLSGHFGCVLSGDSLAQKKPDPAPLREAARQLGVAPTALVMVGDSAADVGAARAAGVPVVCVSYGYAGGIDPHALGADAVIDTMDALLPALAGLGPA